MREFEIRQALVARLQRQHQNDDSLIVPELGLCEGEGRVDVAVVNGSLSGYEIKSERDTLERLVSQVPTYGRCLDRAHIVLAEKHLNEGTALVPDWWGIVVARPLGRGTLCLSVERPGRANPGVDPDAVVQLLWRNEAQALCRKHQIKVRSNAPRRELWSNLREGLPKRVLLAEVRSALKARGDWRVAPPLFRRGAIDSTEPTAEDRRRSLEWLLSTNSERRQR